MKTTKIISALSLVLIFAAANSLFVRGNTKSIPEDRLKVITYVVKVDNINLISDNRHYLIIMTDGAGRQISSSQTFRPGLSSYIFKELGNVRGTRVAMMVQEPSAPGSAAISSSSKTGTFFGGQTYLFRLGANPEAIDAGKPEN